ncbi:hypothetical protein ADH76_10150 [Enterocloster clostridioformis]|nr:hypothetical protein A4V08_24450 [Lachnoclostridium sp. YL32]OXE68811.1 hypothetical protein ADH76_10150 [Enterocloster clostridioformis]
MGISIVIIARYAGSTCFHIMTLIFYRAEKTAFASTLLKTGIIAASVERCWIWRIGKRSRDRQQMKK